MTRFGIIGRNFIVDMMLAAMEAVPEVKAVALYSRDQAAAEAYAAAHGMLYAYSNIRELAASPEIDAVYIASPNSLHYEQAKLMLERGKHVLCEKPACSNAAQVRELVRLVSEKGLVFLEAMRQVYGSALQIVRENLPRVGQLRQVCFSYSKTSSRYGRFLAGEPINTFDPSLSNASVMDLGCYGIHALVHLFGKPEAVSAQAIHLGNGFEAAGTVLMRYPDFMAEVIYSKVNDLNIPSVISGEKGSLCLDSVNNTTKIWLQMNGCEPERLEYTPEKPTDMVCELRAFDRFITEGISPIHENAASIMTAEILDEARRQTGTIFPADEE